MTFQSENQPIHPPAAPGSPRPCFSCGRHEFSTTELSDEDSSRGRRASCAPVGSMERGISLSLLDQFSTTYASFASRMVLRDELPPRCHTFSFPLFSCTYELPNLQVLCFDIVATAPGRGGVSPIIPLKSYFN